MMRKIGIRSRESGVTVKSGKALAGLILAILLISISLAGCGGGSGGKSPQNPTSGVINNVIGVGVVMESRSAITGNSFGARALDSSGKPVEITRGQSGFSY